MLNNFEGYGTGATLVLDANQITGYYNPIPESRIIDEYDRNLSLSI